MAAALMLPLVLAACGGGSNSSSGGGSGGIQIPADLVRATTAMDAVDVADAKFYAASYEGGVMTVANDSSGNPATLVGTSVTINTPALVATGNTPVVFNQFPILGSRKVTASVSENLVVLGTSNVPQGIEHAITLTFSVEDVTVTLNSGNTVHGFGYKMHHAAASVDSSRFVVAEYVAFGDYYQASGAVAVLARSAHHGALTPVSVINALAAATLMATYTIPRGGAQGVFFHSDAGKERLLYNNNAGTLSADFAAGVLTLNLTVDGYSLVQVIGQGVNIANRSAAWRRDGFLKITDFEMTISGNTFHNRHCRSAGGESACDGTVDYINANTSANALDMTNGAAGTNMTLQMSGMFGGPNAEEVAGSIGQTTGSADTGMRLQFLAAGKGGRE